MIEVSNLGKTFIKDGNKIEVLKDVNLEINRGESLAILGVSGAGKSTFLTILGILDHPTSGHILYNNVDVFGWNEQKQAEYRNKEIGFVFQSHHLLPEFTSLENTMMPALINGVPMQEAREKAEIALTELGLGDRLVHKPGELSGGEQQRVAVARALIMEPGILLADEPTGNLDTKTGEKIHDILLDLNKTKDITLVIVTHNKHLADRMSRTIGLQDGRVCNL
ncbi:MAG: ABC transporter ATP-binding protein [Syntrophobacterales bacterium]|nr:ABC transporter ATP-binding protein [Syntrophobacterales bacterium]